MLCKKCLVHNRWGIKERSLNLDSRKQTAVSIQFECRPKDSVFG